MVFLLNYFPVEILHLIFLHLWANDIFLSLFNITPYLDSVIYNYNNYYVDFRNIHKKTYDRLMVDYKDKIKCLVISSVVSVPGFAHIKNFLTLYDLSEFIRLDKLSLIEIDEKYFDVILANIFRFDNLVSLKLDRISNYSGSRFNHAVRRLTRLDLPDAIFFKNFTRESIPNLRCLSVVRCTFEQLNHIFDIVPIRTFETFALTNGIISTIGDNAWPRFNRYPNRLKRLNLQIDFEPVTLNELRGLLSQLPLLTHLDIKGEGECDLADGRRWKDFLAATYGNQLINFDFCFTITTYTDFAADEILTPFFGPFWLNRRRPWFVSYSGRGLIYTVPRYASTWCRSDENLSFQTTAYDEAISYNAINELAVHNPSTAPVHRFNHANLLRISADAYDVTLENLTAIVRVTGIKDLEISVTIPHHLLNLMPYLYRLSLVNISSLYAILHKVDWRLQFHQIRVLEINYNPTDHRYTDVPPEALCRMFPNIRRLRMDGLPIRRSYITRSIDGFHSMTSCKFQIDWDEQRKDSIRQDLERETCRLISNRDETNFCFHFELLFLHLFIWDTNQ